MKEHHNIQLSLSITKTNDGTMCYEFPTHVIKGFKIQRNTLNSDSNNDFLRKSGLYMLFDHDKKRVYIGESENILTRLLQHEVKSFWNEAIVFLTKIENLNKAQIKWLERKIYKKVKEVNRYKIMNSNIPTKGNLSVIDTNTTNDIFLHIKEILERIGCKIFEKLNVETSQNLQPEELLKSKVDDKNEKIKSNPLKADFNKECVTKIQNKFNITLIKKSKTLYYDEENTLGLTCQVSSSKIKDKYTLFWFGFTPIQYKYLKKFQKKYVAFGCGSEKNTFLFSFKKFVPLLKYLSKTKNHHWNIQIHKINNTFFLYQHKRKNKEHMLDITKYKIN